MGIKYFTEEDREQLSEYILKSPLSSCYHKIGWLDVVEKSFGHRTYYLINKNSQSEITGILPLVQLKSFLFGNFMVSLPYFTYGGICAEDIETHYLLLKEATNIAKELNVNHMELRHIAPVCNNFPVKIKKVTMRLPLTAKSEDIWESFTSNLRRKIRKPKKEGMFVRLGREEELDSFYTVFSINMRDLGTPVYPKKFFKNILNEFQNDTWILTVYVNEREPVASIFMVGFKNSIEIPWASSIMKYNRFYPNFLLYWSAIEFAIKHGYSVFDFGRSTIDEGTYNFKKQWEAQPLQLYWHYWLRDGESLPELNPKNPKYQVAIKCWKRLPLGLTKIMGPLIVKNLP